MVKATRLKYPSISRLTSSWGSLRRQTVVLSAAFLQLSDTDSLRSTQSRMAAADTDLDSGDFQHMSVLYIRCLSSPLHQMYVLFIDQMSVLYIRCLSSTSDVSPLHQCFSSTSCLSVLQLKAWLVERVANEQDCIICDLQVQNRLSTAANPLHKCHSQKRI